MRATRRQDLLAVALVGAMAFTATIARAADFVGSVQGAGSPIAGATVTLYAAGSGAPTQLAEGMTDDRGAFKLQIGQAPADSVLYVIAIDGEGNLWAADNLLVGSQSTVWSTLGGGLSKLAPNGRPLSPMTFGYRGGGIDDPGFGIAIGADDKVWASSLDGRAISAHDRNTGRPLSPETGYNFGGQLGQIQGIITTPNGDVWALDNEKSQIVYLPKGDATKGRILGRTVKGKPVDGTLKVKGPFHLAIDQQDRIWVTNSDNTVTRFPASDPGKAEQIKVGYVPRGIAIDGNDHVWVANGFGHTVTELCGARPGNNPPGTKTGDPLSPPGGYIGGMQTVITDVAIDPAGNVWVANNWDLPYEGFKKVPEPALATRFGGNGVVVFFSLAKPVRTPLIGPPHQP